jgi:hypothetical protein
MSWWRKGAQSRGLTTSAHERGLQVEIMQLSSKVNSKE